MTKSTTSQTQTQNLGDTTMKNMETVVTATETEVVKETTVTSQLMVIESDTPLLPIEKLNRNVAVYELNDTEKQMREELIEDIKNAEYHMILSLYYYIKVGKRLIGIKAKFVGQKGRYTKFLQSIGMNERKAQRYTKIGGDKRFAEMDEEQMKRLHHLTQNQMVELTKFDDTQFNTAIADTDFQFGKKGGIKGGEKPSEFTISDDMYYTFKMKDKTYVINEYNDLLVRYIELEKQLRESVVIEGDSIANSIDTVANLYVINKEEVA